MSRIKSFKAEVLSIEFHETHIFFKELYKSFEENKKLSMKE